MTIYHHVMDNPIKRINRLMLDDEIETKTELAEKINRSKATVSENLADEEKLTDTFILRLQDKLGWSAHWIRTGEGPKRLSKNQTSQSIGSMSDSINANIGGDGNTTNLAWAKEDEVNRLKRELEEERQKRLELQEQLIKFLTKGK